MRTEKEMFDLILDLAMKDERIRAVTMNGSRTSKSATHDKYSDFDIQYYVRDIREFTKDEKWYQYFGKILIMQMPEDWYNHPYDYNGRESFTYLMQFTDGNRIDLCLIDCSKLKEIPVEKEPRKVLLNKDNLPELYDIESEEVYFIKPPTEKEYQNCCNEFWWLSLYVVKGLLRDEFYYVKVFLEQHQMEMLIKMLNWKIGIDNNFSVMTGKSSKYLSRYLSEEDMTRFRGLFPNGDYEDIWNKLFLMLDYFKELSIEVGNEFMWDTHPDEGVRITNYIRKMYINRKNEQSNVWFGLR